MRDMAFNLWHLNSWLQRVLLDSTGAHPCVTPTLPPLAPVEGQEPSVCKFPLRAPEQRSASSSTPVSCLRLAALPARGVSAREGPTNPRELRSWSREALPDAATRAGVRRNPPGPGRWNLCVPGVGLRCRRWASCERAGAHPENWSLGTSRGLLYPSTSSEGPDKFGPGQRDAGGLLRVVQGLPRGQRSPRMRSPGLHHRIAPLPVCDQVPHRGNVFPASDPPKSSQSSDQTAAKFYACLEALGLRRGRPRPPNPEDRESTACANVDLEVWRLRLHPVLLAP
ncbi:uncharacterized protein LOC129619545 [Bubalus kerabau]|uniref:uncharacterized protein LOC129619545 n=1 Tax=Bubalus carabanensis TaxID=3119969 RepID=UPI00244E8D14|nr:uncharacterized protein LOC129619545 [Bubalus carabanensis]